MCDDEYKYVSIYHKNEIYCLQKETLIVQVFNTNGQWSRNLHPIFDSQMFRCALKGTQPLLCISNNKLYAAMKNNNRQEFYKNYKIFSEIRVFTLKGEYLHSIDVKNAINGICSHSSGVLVDIGKLFVFDDGDVLNITKTQLHVRNPCGHILTQGASDQLGNNYFIMEYPNENSIIYVQKHGENCHQLRRIQSGCIGQHANSFITAKQIVVSKLNEIFVHDFGQLTIFVLKPDGVIIRSIAEQTNCKNNHGNIYHNSKQEVICMGLMDNGKLVIVYDKTIFIYVNQRTPTTYLLSSETLIDPLRLLPPPIIHVNPSLQLQPKPPITNAYPPQLIASINTPLPLPK